MQSSLYDSGNQKDFRWHLNLSFPDTKESYTNSGDKFKELYSPENTSWNDDVV